MKLLPNSLIAVSSLLFLAAGCATSPQLARETEVITDPPGARIEVNGEYVGDAPVSVKLRQRGDKIVGEIFVRAIPSEANLPPATKRLIGPVVPLTGGADPVPAKLFFDLRRNGTATRSPFPAVNPPAVNPPANHPAKTVYTGTGFVVAEGGYVLTCQHVIKHASKIEVRDGKGAKHSAQVVVEDAGNDLCLLHSDDLQLKPIPAAPPNSVKVGETVYLLGFPMEGIFLENTTPVAGNGVVASLRGLEGDPRHLQVTLPINPGNSGGPVLDPYGRWIGVASHKLSDSYSVANTKQIPQGINFAVKGSLVVPLFESAQDLKLTFGDEKENLSLEDATRRFSESIVLVTANR